jgi:CRISPR system Cascade subunit CasD
MPTLLLRMRAPMMSWGDHSAFGNRDTRIEPTKSAVIGLLCAALGRPRHESIADLTESGKLTMGIRVNQEGIVQCDYHTIRTSPREAKVETALSDRYYVADGDYLVGLAGDRALLETLDKALQQPCWQLFFGRKSFVPSRPVRVQVDDQDLESALRHFPYELRGRQKKPSQNLRFVLEVPNSLDVRRDVPLDWQRRHFGNRCVDTKFWEIEETCTFPN